MNKLKRILGITVVLSCFYGICLLNLVDKTDSIPKEFNIYNYAALMAGVILGLLLLIWGSILFLEWCFK